MAHLLLDEQTMNSGKKTREGGHYRSRLSGFTLIELMVVVAIIGILASVAVPGFIRNARKAKASEAVVQLNKLYSSSRTYIIEPHNAPGSARVLPPQFPDSEATTPVASCCHSVGQKCAPTPSDWATPTWISLQFSVDSPHYYRYSYQSTGSAAAGPGSAFRAQAFGDLNCDGTYSTYEMYGIWNNVDMDVHGSAGMYSDKDLD